MVSFSSIEFISILNDEISDGYFDRASKFSVKSSASKIGLKVP